MNRDVERDDELDNERAPMIQDSPKELPEIPMCGFLSVRYYQPFFDVDTVDITNRISQSLFYCNREQNFLTTIGDKPDAYGPFWISTTLVFVLAVSSHLSKWFNSWLKGDVMDYNFQAILSASSFVYGFIGFVPIAVWFAFKTYDPKLRFVSVLCLYGYSIAVFLPAVLLCAAPSESISWLALLVASITSSLFLLRNLAPAIVNTHPQHAAVLLGILGAIQIGFAIVLKMYFFTK